MIVAVYGKSCSGKTILSNSLSEELSIDVRHCGEVVKTLAAKRGIPPGELSFEDHMMIDEETRQEVGRQGKLIVEGCFLDNVLAGCEVILVELQCSDDVRHSRYDQRLSSMSFEEREKSDLEVKAHLYRDAQGHLPDFTVDTTELKTEETVMEVRTWLQARGFLS